MARCPPLDVITPVSTYVLPLSKIISSVIPSSVQKATPRVITLYTIDTYMSLFYLKKKDVRFGALIEIGSGSIVVSIIKSDAAKENPEIIWSQREFASLKSIKSHEQNDKSIMTVLMNVILLVNSSGYKALKGYDPNARIRHVQISITAPWSYTISKTIEYSDDQEFIITPELIKNLTATAQKKADENKAEKEAVNKHGLTILAKNIAGIQSNGYKTTKPLNQKVKYVSITQISAVAETSITDAVIDLQRKILPNADLKMYSFMMLFQTLTQKLYPKINDFCLIDVTYEATEIAVVKNSTLQYCTQTIIGINTLARGLAEVLKIPHEEALVFIREPYYSTALKTLSDSKTKAVQEVLQNYREQLVKLFKETGDNLSIPRIIFLHGTAVADAVLQTEVMAAAHIATSSTHAVLEISSEILTKSYTAEQKKKLFSVTSDTSVLLAAQFFHTKEKMGNFIHE